jgi:hypothetical protein
VGAHLNGSTWTKAEIIEFLVDVGVVIDEDAVKQFNKTELQALMAAFLTNDGDEVEALLGG